MVFTVVYHGEKIDVNNLDDNKNYRLIHPDFAADEDERHNNSFLCLRSNEVEDAVRKMAKDELKFLNDPSDDEAKRQRLRELYPQRWSDENGVRQDIVVVDSLMLKFLKEEAA